ncbi:MAG: type II toxin-antitoxin system HipA family toxin [Desulfuromonadales bacterium]|nr:type II toxin-antitoxin system HipA family toxin [Desulfuromonadales bacterium]
MIYRIEAWIIINGSYCNAGEMVCEIAENGRAGGAFRYHREYLELPGAFALDPVSLPLKSDTFPVRHPGVFAVFEDSLPDDWGRRLLVRKHQLPRHRQNLPELLLALGSAGLGALAYRESGHPELPQPDTSIINLAELVREAELFEQGEREDSAISLLLSAGSSPGGARPKALVYDDVRNIHYIAKFSSTRDQVDVVKIEAATMSLAAKAGLVIPPCRLEECGNRQVLLVQRYDIGDAGRRHMISLQTLLKMEGYYNCRYYDVLEIVRKISADPQRDAELLFRQMVFNAVISNTDDHLKNFWMVRDMHDGWRLSPSFDLLPDIRQAGEHVLFFDLDTHYPGREKLEKLGRLWRIPRAALIVDEVYGAIAGWKEEFSSFGIVPEEIARFAEIGRHVQE